MEAYWISSSCGPISVGSRLVITPSTEGELAQLMVLVEAFTIYCERNVGYQDNWKRMGWRGSIVRIRERAERLWDRQWDWPAGVPTPNPDDALDLINFAAFLVRGNRGETTRDGDWWK